MNVRLTKDQKIKIANSEDVYNIMQQVLLRENRISRKQEHFWIIGLDNKSRILFIELLALGQQNRVNMNPSDTFRMAIYKLATQAILVHNHPSGGTDLSKEDKDLTDYLYKAGRFLKIEVIDHLVITETDYFSFEDNGLMDAIKNSGVWELIDTTKTDLTQMKMEIAAQKAAKENSKEIAKKMLAKGTSVELIREYTGLTIREMNKILKEIGE
ncbi:JAB domain-containing protein [Fluviicola taffensis]|uniref:JAB domain-containing protein n=1 Tax=Fluviicola taffensis TaxID=191579 RepID=UPI00313790EC